MTRLIQAGAAGSVALAVHAALNARFLRRPPAVAPPVEVPVSVLIPARDEALNIGPCIESVLASAGVPDLEVLVLDDHSSDRTREIASSFAGRDPRVRVLTGRELPPGWLGKPHACQQLGDAARGDVLVFVDADVRLQPDAVAATLFLMQRYGLDLTSPYPRQLAVTTAERLVQPLLQWSWLTFLPLRVAERPRPESMVAANGQVLAISRRAWEAVGGHAAVADRVIEDVWLARAVKRAGLRATVVDGTELASCRMYGSWDELRDGYTKSLWAAFGSPLGAVLGGSLLALLYVVPPLGMFRRATRAWAVAGYVAGVCGRLVSARRTGGRVADAWMHPASIATLLSLLVRSWRARRAGTLKWKGRRLLAAGEPGG